MSQDAPISLWRARGLNLVVLSASGVEYEAICGGHAGARRVARGFLVPLGEDGAAEVRGVFARFEGWPPESGAAWKDADLSSMRGALARVGSIALDEARVAELTEGWIPVTTPRGPGVLVTDNAG